MVNKNYVLSSVTTKILSQYYYNIIWCKNNYNEEDLATSEEAGYSIG